MDRYDRIDALTLATVLVCAIARTKPTTWIDSQSVKFFRQTVFSDA